MSIINDTIDYERKVDLLRVYSGYYTDDDFQSIFGVDNIKDLLDTYTYIEIRSMLSNTLSNTIDSEFGIGDIVVVRKPFLRNGSYSYYNGLIIGKHIVFDSDGNRINALHHYSYDVLIQTDTFNDGYSYDIRKLTANEMKRTGNVVQGTSSVVNEYNQFAIDRPV